MLTPVRVGVVGVQGAPGQEAQIDLEMLVFPTDGQISFLGDTTMNFIDTPENSPAIEFVDRSTTGRDFMCADNWVVGGTNSNPGFRVPCFQDKAVFSQV